MKIRYIKIQYSNFLCLPVTQTIFFGGQAQLDDFLGIFYKVIIINFQNSEIFLWRGAQKDRKAILQKDLLLMQ